MHKRELSTPLLFLIAGTRVALGIGVGLLIAGRIRESRRRRLGGVLLGAGIASTFPIARRVFRRSPAIAETELAA